ncbi:MAG: serine hydrolase [Nevskia sp.]|nr:serine hydrolase [Nevskia sp.]
MTGKATAQVPARSRAPTDAEIRGLLAEQVEVRKLSVGVVAGVVDGSGRRVFAAGGYGQGDARRLGGDTLFEIGSVTKVFTALLLTDMAQRGELRIDDPIQNYLPDGVRAPERQGRAITLADLATHTSGLPRMPDNNRPKDPAYPFADYGVDRLYEYLSSYQLGHQPGTQYLYSNLGYALLGNLLARRAGIDYEALVATRVCAPLAMTSTRISLTPVMRERLAPGHAADLAPMSRPDNPTFAGSGALKSNVNDLLNLLAASLGYVHTPLAPALAALLSVRRPTGEAGAHTALGWEIATRGGNDVVWKAGSTSGYKSFTGYVPANGIGVVVLSNTNAERGVDEIGFRMLGVRQDGA